MTPHTKQIVQELADRLSSTEFELPGIVDIRSRQVFAQHIIDSLRYERSIQLHRTRNTSSNTDPNGDFFHPLKAAAYWNANGHQEEACWLVFLAVHFGEHNKGGWRYLSDVYGKRGGADLWNWQFISNNTEGFRSWLNQVQAEIKSDTRKGGFGNHRKYESLDAYKPRGTGSVIASYITWVRPPQTQMQRIENIITSGGDAFNALYKSLVAVHGFGRLAKFDFIMTLSRLGIINVRPSIPYLTGATGPLAGARLLFTGDKDSKMNSKLLDEAIVSLGNELDLGMDILEDALCNWQKSPNEYKKFTG
jgi:hypothetical protein